tara:strand:+ start:137 stop:442 length:306 start_codon:yes stop_codon:yes gene_type:complete
MKKIFQKLKFLLVIVQLLRQRKNLKKKLNQSTNNINKPIQVGSFSDDILTANVLVKDRNVTINVSGFMNEFDAMLWARMQSELWLKELQFKKDLNRNTTLH